MTPETILELLDKGGTLALALIVWFELRGVRSAVEALSGSFTRLSNEPQREPTVRP